jgi:uncharacterized protein YfaS (alpha-2-macroglobulin family)
MHAFHKFPYRLTFPVLVASALFTLVVVFRSFSEPNAEPSAATYTRGTLSVTIPFHAPRPGSGHLTADILDPEDHVLGSAEQSPQLSKGDGTWRIDIALRKPLPLDDLVWDRVRYRYEYSGESTAAIEGIQSISQILRRPVVHILAQKSYIAGAPAAIRVIATDSKDDAIIASGTVHLELLIPDHPARPLFTGHINRRGTTEAQFHFPAGLIGDYQLRYLVDTPIGSSESTEPVQLQDKLSILLTTEKPIYQPGQTIHVRALALDRSDHNAAANRRLTFEVEDSRGNKVFKRATQTDKFGIASAEFALADEVNLGTYHLRALIGDPDSATSTAELALNVDRYVLPKFKVGIEFSDKDHAAKRGYRPGDHVTGTVRANYFFGKPVDHAEIAVKASAMDVAVFEAASENGPETMKTDADGAYHFDLKLPDYFAGRPLTQDVARVLIEATVKDSAGHSETRGEPITVSESPLLITAIPEGGVLIPNLDNQLFILTSYPDGTPATADLNIHASGNRDQHIATDAGGVAVVHIKVGMNPETLRIEASDKEGNHASASPNLELRQDSDQILLRTERAVYRAGDRIQLHVFSTRHSGSAYVDIVKDSQTILTRDLDLTNGEADLTLTATPEMAGTLDLNAYLFGRDAQPVADHRLVFVQPADELHIETTADVPVYKPGDEARIRFRVTNSHGEGVHAALGLQIVDEAVFALAEKQPGFAKVFFYLEQEAMKPRYEIHSFGMSDIVEPVQNPQSQAAKDQHDRAARALFSATEMVNPNRFDTEFGRSLPQSKQAEYTSRYQAVYTAQLRRIATQLSRDYNRNPDAFDLPKALKSMSERDAWGTPLRTEQVRWIRGKTRYYYIQSAGPDQQFGTADDLAAYIEVHSGSIAMPPINSGGIIDLQTEHDRGPFNGRAQVIGSVVDPSGAIIPGTTVKLRDVSNGSTHEAISDAVGRFDLSGLPPGTYEIELSAAGFNSVKREFTIRARDRAILSATLAVGSASQTVTVAMQSEIMTTGAMAQGMAHGAMGGIIGGLADRGMALNGRAVAALKMAAPPGPMAQAAVVDSLTAPAASPAPHVRSWFPEALYINPEIITDANGVASITIPLADSITTWRMAMLASTEHGALGTGTSSLKVFQDFFVDLDLPVTLTQGDRVSLPVALYNYSGGRGDVSLNLQPDDWFSLVDDTPDKTVSVDSNRVGSSQFTLEARRIGKFKLTLTAHMKGAANRADIVVREIEVVPNGREQNAVFNGRLEPQHDARHSIDFPAAAIPDAGKIYVRLYPGPLSQVIEGMDSILQMPYGCFEQTSSATYPDVLALDYMKRTKKLTPEVHAKAEGFIAQGYQRLLTFEVPGGGFSWFGQAPANKILTAYGLMEFSNMSRVYDVDPHLIERTQQWLASQQQPDGSWKPDTGFINEGATNRYNSDVLRITAYIAWALENTGYRGPAVENASRYIEQHLNAKADAYTLAVVANFAVERDKNSAFTRQAMQDLLDARTEKDDQVWWSVDETSVYSTGASAAVETTGLAVQAILKWGQASGTARKALTYIASKKDASGTWGTTQATIMALRALLLATEIGSADVRGTVEVMLNGKSAEKLVLTPENNDLFHQFVLKDIDARANSIQLHFEGSGGLAYQVVGRYFVPWPVSANDKPVVKEPLSIEVAYDRTKLAQNDIATATATIKNNLPKSANMVMVDLGIPPGFDLLSEDLQDYLEKTAGSASGRLEKFSLTATQAILYFNAFAPDSTVTIHYRLRAKYPIRAHTFQSRVYEYYDPAVSATAKPVQLEVRTR